MPEQTQGSGNNLTSYIRDGLSFQKEVTRLVDTVAQVGGPARRRTRQRPQRVRTVLLVLLGQFKLVEENGEIWAEVEARTGRVTKASAATARSLVAGAGPKLGSGGARPSPATVQCSIAHSSRSSAHRCGDHPAPSRQPEPGRGSVENIGPRSNGRSDAEKYTSRHGEDTIRRAVDLQGRSDRAGDDHPGGPLGHRVREPRGSVLDLRHL